ncbi:MAG: hypothetical protein RJA61_382 [Candidatus Parcubacteria bacterium]|jgi:ribosomal protein L19
MKKHFILFTLALSLIGSMTVYAQTNNLSGTEDFPPEIHIGKGGLVKAQGIKVMQISGNTIFARFIWQEAYLRLTIKTDSSTRITRRYGGTLPLSQISVGDWLVIEGELERGSESFSVKATAIKDVSIFTQDEVKTSGTITESIGGGSTLKLQSKEKGLIEIRTDGTTHIKKGSLSISPKDIQVGDTITSVLGVFDTAKKSMQATFIEVFVNMNIFTPQNFQGTLVSIEKTTLPTTIVIAVGNKNYTVKLTEKTSIMRASRALVTLPRFVVGDTIRFYGNITEQDLNVIDNVLVVRNISL